MSAIEVRCSTYGRNQWGCQIYEHGRIVEYVDGNLDDVRSLDKLERDIEAAYRAGDSTLAFAEEEVDDPPSD